MDSAGGGGLLRSLAHVTGHPPSDRCSSGQGPGQTLPEEKSFTESPDFLFLAQWWRQTFSSEVMVKEVAGFLP